MKPLSLFLIGAILLSSIKTAADAQRDFFDGNDLKEDFAFLDKNNDGYIDIHEFRSAAAGVLEDDLSRFFTHFDDDRDAVLSFQEYTGVPNYS